MSKIGTIARYELLMAWRRRSLPILWLVLVLTSLAFSLLVASYDRSTSIRIIDPLTRAAAAESGWTVDAFMRTSTMASYVGLIMLVFSLALVLISAETIPLDRQFKVREALEALPISRAEYLGGKVFGAWSGVILIVITGGAVSTITQRALVGEFDLRVIALLWLVMALPLSLTNSAVSVLAASFWGSRRTAVLFNLLLLPGCALLLWVAFMNLSFVSGLIHPAYIHSFTSLLNGESQTIEIAVHLVMGLALLAGVLLLAWMVVWALLRFQDAR